MIIDLHGMTVEDSIPFILSSLMNLDMSFYNTLTIITGNGFGFLMSSTLNLLDEEDRDYKVEKGKIIVYKKNEETFNDFDNWMDYLKTEEDND
ncbi:MAG: Smr/MutS family protein [Mycoplasmataceae bacterium]|nr:Smr/MutS family protein [Mycoplasmataceae bacterium]MBR2848970.1 Smr/MutS family protein [Mycoplasmataceae bacterium]MBR3347901.1 Smr/MutS family protein [Mycoplasmataceae bacterium]